MKAVLVVTPWDIVVLGAAVAVALVIAGAVIHDWWRFRKPRQKGGA